MCLSLELSQVLDYMPPGKFHRLARMCSLQGDTVHYAYSMNWIAPRLKWLQWTLTRNSCLNIGRVWMLFEHTKPEQRVQTERTPSKRFQERNIQKHPRFWRGPKGVHLMAIPSKKNKSWLRIWGWSLWVLHHGFWRKSRSSIRCDQRITRNVQRDGEAWARSVDFSTVQGSGCEKLATAQRWDVIGSVGKFHTCPAPAVCNRRVQTEKVVQWMFYPAIVWSGPANAGGLCLRANCCCFHRTTRPWTSPAISWQRPCTKSGPSISSRRMWNVELEKQILCTAEPKTQAM